MLLLQRCINGMLGLDSIKLWLARTYKTPILMAIAMPNFSRRLI